jgi:PAS domain S-box-containing protein
MLDFFLRRKRAPGAGFGVAIRERGARSSIDMSERQNDNVDPNELSSRLAAIVASSDDAIISKTLDGTIVTWNEGAERMFGYAAHEAVGKQITLIIPTDHLSEEPAILERLRRGERIDHYQTVRQRKDGTRIDISLSVSPLRNAAGTIVGASKIARDITESKHLQHELEGALRAERDARGEAERLSRLKDEFLATLSHELRTPLNAILGWATLLKQVPAGSTDHLRGLETIERNARVQSQIIGDLLDMSRIISGKVQLDVQPVDLNEVVAAAIEAVRPSAEGKKLRLRTTLDAKAGRIRGDPNRLQQVFWNLLTNAVKFTPAGGSVHVVLERVNSHVEVSVEDTGIGINPEFLGFVFDRFRQADASTTRRHAGLGIGLSIVKHLVELHGGNVRVKSQGQGLGATFSVVLPISVVRDGPSRPPSQSFGDADVATLKLPSLAGVTALVVDDESDARVLIGRLIEAAGGSAVPAESVQEALRLIDAHRIDVVVSDIGMPDVDGYGLIQEIRARDTPARNVMAIALTAYARAEDRQRALLAGYQMHLAKPIDPRELIAGIASLLNLPRRGNGGPQGS